MRTAAATAACVSGLATSADGAAIGAARLGAEGEVSPAESVGTMPTPLPAPEMEAAPPPPETGAGAMSVGTATSSAPAGTASQAIAKKDEAFQRGLRAIAGV